MKCMGTDGSYGLTWMTTCPSTDWTGSWASRAEALGTGCWDLGRPGSVLHIFHTMDQTFCMGPPGIQRQQVFTAHRFGNHLFRIQLGMAQLYWNK